MFIKKNKTLMFSLLSIVFLSFIVSAVLIQQGTEISNDGGYNLTVLSNSTVDWIDVQENKIIFGNPYFLAINNSNTILNKIDFTGNGNARTISNVISQENRFGIGDSSATFLQSDSFIEVQNSTDFSTELQNGMTISAWIKPNSLGGNNEGRIIDTTTATNTANGFAFRLNTNNRASIRINASTDVVTSNGVITIGQWQHVLVTVNATGRVTHYVNGVQTGTPANTGSLSALTSINSLCIGARAGDGTCNTDRTFNGSISEVIIFDRVLTAQEVGMLYNTSYEELGIQAVRYYPLDRRALINFENTEKTLYHNGTNLCLATGSNINSNNGNKSVSLLYREHCYILGNFALIEGENRQNSPLWFSSSSATQKTIASNLTETINATVIINVQNCATVQEVRYRSNTGAFQRTYTPNQFSCSNNQLTLNLVGIESSQNSNTLTILYSTLVPVETSLCPSLFSGFESLGGRIKTMIVIFGIVIVLSAILLLVIVVKRIQDTGGMPDLSDIPDTIKLVGSIFLGLFSLIIVMFAVMISLGGIC